VVALDCPPSISLLSESVLHAADVLLVPLIPTTLSVRTLDQLTGVHRRLRRQAAGHPGLLLDDRPAQAAHKEIATTLPAQRKDVATAAIPALSIIEQMSVRRPQWPSSRRARPPRATWSCGRRPPTGRGWRTEADPPS
jgi:cellulose biosynthesis protein BcsQ